MVNPHARPGLGGDEPNERPLHLQKLRPYHPRHPAPAHKQDEQNAEQITLAKPNFLPSAVREAK